MLQMYPDCDNDPKKMELSHSESKGISINELNDDTLLEIFSYLEIGDIKHVDNVCTRWKRLCYDSWKLVEGVECRGSIWYLLGAQRDRRLYELTCVNDLRDILGKCGQFITYFRLSCRRPIDSAIFRSLLKTVPRFCNNLLDVEIDSVYSPAAMIGESNVNTCSKLKRIIVKRTYEEVENELAELLRRNRNLKFLKIGENDCNEMSGKFLYNISPDTIEQLHIKKSYDLQSHYFGPAIKTFKQLKVLDISYCTHIKDEGIAALSALDKLEILKMVNLAKVSDGPIGNLPSTLEILHCRGCYCIRDSGVMKLIERATNLTKLDLSFCAITYKTIEAAIKITKRRTNGIILKLDIHGTFRIPTNLAMELSPLLKLTGGQYTQRRR